MARMMALLRCTLVARAASVAIEVGFCDDNGHGFYTKQPPDHLERWELPQDNGSHLVIPWKIDRRMANRNVTSYFVDVRTSQPVLNLFVGRFGGFPQDICAAEGSKARDAVNVAGSSTVTCSPYTGDAPTVQRSTSFEIPDALRLMASWDVTVVVRGYGSHAPIGRPADSIPCVWWCHTYRRSRKADAESASTSTQMRLRELDDQWTLQRWMEEWWQVLPCWWSCGSGSAQGGPAPSTASPMKPSRRRRRLPRWLHGAWQRLRGKSEL